MVKKCVILAGGLGSRLAEETDIRPKPMVEIGNYPIIWHIMKIYSYYGINEFIICLGYKGYMIKEYFLKYYERVSDITIDLNQNETHIHKNRSEPWKITLVETGASTMTGGRLKRVAKYLGNEDFCLTYGDGLADVNIQKLIAMHQSEGCLATVTAIRPPLRFGVLNLVDNKVSSFSEKPRDDWINGGFFVLSPETLSLIEGDLMPWEDKPMQLLAKRGELNVYFHEGFWQPMDTLREKHLLEKLWNEERAPWKLWGNDAPIKALSY